MRANRYLVVVCAGLETFIDLLQDVLHRYFTFGCVSVPLRAGRGKDCQEHIRCSPRSGNGTPAHVSQLLLLFFRVASHAFPLPYQRWLSGGSYALQWRGPWASVSMASRAHHELGIQSGRTSPSRKSVGKEKEMRQSKHRLLPLHVSPPHDAAPATGVAWLLYRSGGGCGHHNYNCCRRASCFASASPPTSWWHR